MSSVAVARADPFLATNYGKRIGILIVTYNAVTTLYKVLQRIPPEVWENVEEVAVFDDASQDATYEFALGLQALKTWPKLNVLKHEQNLGYGGNQKAGYLYFIDKGLDAVILLHGDGQYAPEILSHLYHPIVTGKADAVFGSRMMKVYGGAIRGGMPFYKYLGNRILSVYENRALGMSLTEFHSGYRAYNLHALREIDFSRMTNDFHFDTEIIIKLNYQGFRIVEVPIPTYYGTELCYVDGLKYAGDVVNAVSHFRKTISGEQSFPEFEEYFTPYPLKQTKYSSHSFAVQMAGNNQDILDLGSGAGFVARELHANGNRIMGVDQQDPLDNSGAFDEYIQADLDFGLGRVIDRLAAQRFTRVLMLDILEHLKRPERLLAECHQVLSPDGKIVVSIPNIANLTVRWDLLWGRFDYTQRGIFDKTHLRFFTRKTARRMIEEAGFRIEQERMTVMPVHLAWGLPPDRFLAKALGELLALLTRIMPGLFGYQMMFIARRVA